VFESPRAGVSMTLVQPTKRDSAERRAQSHEEHLAILSAVEDGDCDRVAVATETHLRNGFSAILSRLVDDPGPDPFDAE